MRHAPSRRLYGREGAPALGADAALADGGA